MNPHQFERFHRLVDSFLRQRGVMRQRDERGVYDDRELTPALEVHSLAQYCSTLAEPEWPVHIARLLGAAVATRAEWQRAQAKDYDYAKPLLRLELRPERVLTRQHAAGPAEALLSDTGSADADELPARGPLALRPWLPGLVQGLSLQLEGAAVAVSAAELDSWGADPDEVFQLALRNVKRAGLLTPRVHPLKKGGGGEVMALLDGPRFMASHTMFISAYASEAIDKGILFVVPHDRIVVFHAIEGAASVHAAIARLAAFALRASADAPHALSHRLYWWHEGTFTHLPLEHSLSGMSFNPPDAFVEQVLVPLDALLPPDSSDP